MHLYIIILELFISLYYKNVIVVQILPRKVICKKYKCFAAHYLISVFSSHVGFSLKCKVADKPIYVALLALKILLNILVT